MKFTRISGSTALVLLALTGCATATTSVSNSTNAVSAGGSTNRIAQSTQNVAVTNATTASTNAVGSPTNASAASTNAVGPSTNATTTSTRSTASTTQSTAPSGSSSQSGSKASTPTEWFLDVPKGYPVKVFQVDAPSASPTVTTMEPGGLGVIPILAPYHTGTIDTFQMRDETVQIRFSRNGPLFMTTPDTAYQIQLTPVSGGSSQMTVRGVSDSAGGIPVPSDPGMNLAFQIAGQTVGRITEPAQVWPKVIVNAMKYESLHTDGIMDPHEMAPTWLVQGSAVGNRKQISATAKGNGFTYNVNLYWTSQTYPVNAPAITSPENSGLASVLGSFGEHDYASKSAPVKAMDAQISQSSGVAQSVDLGTGITGTLTGVDTGMNLVTWHEGEWTLQVYGGSAADDTQLAKSMVAYLHIYLLPETHGVVSVVNAGDGEHTSVNWVSGYTLYECSDYHFAIDALKMAVSMRAYPSGAALHY